MIFYFPNGKSTIWGIYSEYVLFLGHPLSKSKNIYSIYIYIIYSNIYKFYVHDMFMKDPHFPCEVHPFFRDSLPKSGVPRSVALAVGIPACMLGTLLASRYWRPFGPDTWRARPASHPGWSSSHRHASQYPI